MRQITTLAVMQAAWKSYQNWVELRGTTSQCQNNERCMHAWVTTSQPNGFVRNAMKGGRSVTIFMLTRRNCLEVIVV